MPTARISPLASADVGNLAQRIGEGIRRDLQSGAIRPGQPLPTEARYAAHHNVSVGTIRRAFDPLVAQGLVERQQGRGCFAADDLANIDRTVAIIATSTIAAGGSSLFFTDLMALLKDALRQRGLTPQVVGIDSAHDPKIDAMLAGAQVSAVISLEPLKRGLLARIPQAGLPYALLGQYPGPDEHQVLLDSEAALEQALAELKDLAPPRRGCYVFAFSTQQRDIVRRFARKLGLKVSVDVVGGGATIAQIEDAGYQLAIDMLRQHHKSPRPILITDDVVARGVTRALLAAGQQAHDWPVAVLCGEQQTILAGWPVQYYAFCNREMAEAAVDLLATQLAGQSPDGPRHIAYHRLSEKAIHPLGALR